MTWQMPGSWRAWFEQIHLQRFCRSSIAASAFMEHLAQCRRCKLGAPSSCCSSLSPAPRRCQCGSQCPVHPCRDGAVPAALPARGTLGMRSPVPCPARNPHPLQQPPASSSAAPWGAGAGAHQHPGAGREVRVPSVPRTALLQCFLFFSQPEAACVSGCFRAAPWQRRAGPPALVPGAGSRGARGPGFAPARRRASRELVSSHAAIGAGDPHGLASCNLAFTRLRSCKGLN